MSAPRDRIPRGSHSEGSHSEGSHSEGSENQDREYALLLTAHANRELTADETRRLLDLAEQHPERQSEIAAMDKMHDCFAGERSLRTAVDEPLDLAEVGDDGYRRLAARAAEAEVQLRARLLHRPGQIAMSGRGRRRWPLAAAALLIAGLCFWLLPQGDDLPGLLPGTPDDSSLGTLATIHLSAELSRSRPVFSWSRAVGASRYDAFIEDREGVVLMRRSPIQAGQNRWNLSNQELDRLELQMEAHKEQGGLFLRIVGQDGSRFRVATSGSLNIVLVD